MGNKPVVTTHQLREAERAEATEARLREAADKPVWTEVMARPLTHAIRHALNVDLPRDVWWIERCRDEAGETLLAQLRARVGELAPRDWLALRHTKAHVWRVLVDTLRRTRWQAPRPVPVDRTSETEAQQWMARFGRGVVVYGP